MNILLGDISSYKGIAVAKFIKINYPEIKIYSFDSRQFTTIFHSKYVYQNFLIEEDNLESYLEIINKYDIDYFIPVINNSLARFWNIKSDFKMTLSYLGDIETYNILNDKVRLHELAKSLEIKTPNRYESLEDAHFPFVIKPTNLSSAKGVLYVNNKNEIPKDYQYDNIIIQDFIQGVGVGYSFYCEKGKIINGFGHKRLAEYPISGGSSTYRESYKDPRMHKIAHKIVNHLEYTGFAMFEFKLTKSNQLYLLEVNPRIWGSINLGLINGFNYFDRILGAPKIKVKKRKKPIKSYVSPLIYVSMLQSLLKFRIEPSAVYFFNIFNSKPDVSLLDDPKGYISTILRKLIKS